MRIAQGAVKGRNKRGKYLPKNLTMSPQTDRIFIAKLDLETDNYIKKQDQVQAVSYTHLTLPTKA